LLNFALYFLLLSLLQKKNFPFSALLRAKIPPLSPNFGQKPKFSIEFFYNLNCI
jgi:hypothetical protein